MARHSIYMNNIGHSCGRVLFQAIFALALLSSPNSWARLGETFDEIRARYGFVVRIDNGDYPQYFFQKDGIEICVRFVNGKSAQEIFSAAVSNVQTVLPEVLNANAQGSTWASTTVGQSTAYMRADGKAIAQYIRPKKSEGRLAMLQIQTTESKRVFNPNGLEF